MGSMALKVIQCLLFCSVYAKWDERIDIHTMVSGKSAKNLSTMAQAYVDLDFYVGAYTTRNYTDRFYVPSPWKAWNVSQYTDAVQGALKIQLANMTELGKTLFRHYFENGTGLIQMKYTCIGDPGDAYRVFALAVNGSKMLSMSLDTTHLWKNKIDKNLTDALIGECAYLLGNLTLNDTCPSWLFNVSRGYRRIKGMLV